MAQTGNMKFTILIPIVLLTSFAAALLTQQNSTAAVRNNTQKATEASVAKLTANWLKEPKMVAKTMIEKYGLPDEETDTMLMWFNNGPWKYSRLENVELPHNFPMAHHDMLQQGIDWKVPSAMVDNLGAYDGSIIVERTRGEVSARCDKEEANFLAFNLAWDVVNKKRSITDARKFYGDTIMQMKASGLDKDHKPYVSGFIVSPSISSVGDPDIATISMSR